MKKSTTLLVASQNGSEIAGLVRQGVMDGWLAASKSTPSKTLNGDGQITDLG